MKPEFSYNKQLREVPKDSDKFNMYMQKLSDSLTNLQSKERVSVLGELAVYLRIAGKLDLAEEYLLEALKIINAEQLGLKIEIQQNLRLGHVLQFKKRFIESDQLFIETVQACRANIDLSPYEAFALQHGGKNLFDQGRYDEALVLFAQALSIRVKNGAPEDQINSTKLALERTRDLIK